MPQVQSQSGFRRSDGSAYVVPQASDSASTDNAGSGEESNPKRRRKKQRPRTWARRMKQKFMPAFWIILGLIGLYMVVRTVLNMTALQ